MVEKGRGGMVSPPTSASFIGASSVPCTQANPRRSRHPRCHRARLRLPASSADELLIGARMSSPIVSHYDVIIAGGGPVGLFLACELGLAGCSVLVLEQSAQPDSPLKRLPF